MHCHTRYDILDVAGTHLLQNLNRLNFFRVLFVSRRLDWTDVNHLSIVLFVHSIFFVDLFKILRLLLNTHVLLFLYILFIISINALLGYFFSCSQVLLGVRFFKSWLLIFVSFRPEFA